MLTDLYNRLKRDVAKGRVVLDQRLLGIGTSLRNGLGVDALALTEPNLERDEDALVLSGLAQLLGQEECAISVSFTPFGHGFSARLVATLGGDWTFPDGFPALVDSPYDAMSLSDMEIIWSPDQARHPDEHAKAQVKFRGRVAIGHLVPGLSPFFGHLRDVPMRGSIQLVAPTENETTKPRRSFNRENQRIIGRCARANTVPFRE